MRYRYLSEVLGQDAEWLKPEIARSDRIQTLVESSEGLDPYSKFRGCHWALSLIADLGCPPGDERLVRLRDRVYARWLDEDHCRECVLPKQAAKYKGGPGVPIIDGRARRCASQEGNALWSTLKIGIADGRAERLAGNLIRWQWPDGGWNCDRTAEATVSSFHETLIPLRALALYAQMSGDPQALAAAERASEVFLSRRLFRRLRDGEVMNPAFLSLRYPPYWHYDVLFGLKVMAESGHVTDPRCSEALDWLESKRLPDGGWPATGKHYTVRLEPAHGSSAVDWGGTSRIRMNEWVTLDALFVLRKAGRQP